MKHPPGLTSWTEAASSAFAVATVLPAAMDSAAIADLFEKVEDGSFVPGSVPLTAELQALRNSNGETLLIVAARCGHEAAVRYLVADCDVDDVDNDNWSALLCAAYAGHVEVTRVLLDAGATVDQPDMMGWTALMWATYKNHPEVVEVLVNARSHVNLIDEEDGLTPLIVAAGRGFHRCVDALLAADAQVNACDKFGSTALIWAARKGHLSVVQSLLNAGAEVDAVGMYSSTALMLATRGNYLNVVDLLLSREPNVNVVDQNGLSALGIAAREGYADIAEALVNSGAFVNQADRFGNWILASAVRSGSANIVRLLLDKFADVNSRDSENRTALHLAIDKSFMDIVLILLERKPNLELKNKDGETPLIRACKSRHVALCQLLVNAGSKISSVDNAGDNALHLALRARSRRLTQTLLANPSDSRLLYRPNRLGQTPYAIDQQNPQPILPLIFGPIDAETHMDSMLGYDVYSNVLADIVCEPSLSLPLTIGLYAKWGSGKSVLLGKMKESMRSFSRSWLDGVQLRWSNTFLFYLLVACICCTTFVCTLVAVSANRHLLVTTAIVGAAVFLALFAAYSLVWFGSEKRAWTRSLRLARSLARGVARLRLLANILTLYAPSQRDKDVISNPVSFLFADYHRLSSIGGEQALAKIVATLFEAAENHFGTLPVRLFCALRSAHPGTHGSLRRHCGFPTVLLAGFTVLTVLIAQGCLIAWLVGGSDVVDVGRVGEWRGETSYLVIALTLFCFALLMVLYPLFVVFRYGMTNVPKRRVNAAARAVHKLRFEGLMQKLQSEVDLLADMIHSLDAFTNSQTRLVVVVDGLDNCEQERMVQTLDALELLFSARKSRPFIVIIAVDPHIIVSAINHNMHSALTGTELTGHDYLKNIVNMPFYLHNSALRQLQNSLREKRESLADWKERFKRQETFHGSHLSLVDGPSGPSGRSRKQTMVVGTKNLGESLLSDDYFSNMNPRAMRRIVNALTLTGRLMRAFEIEFSWLTLGHWVSLIEQWPSRMCWLIDRALDVSNPQMGLAEIYHQLKEHIPNKDSLIELDRNLENFENFLDLASIPGTEQLTVAHVRRFVPCTSNLDPYLRKLIREKRVGMEDPRVDEGMQGMVLSPNARHLFQDDQSWQLVDRPLVEMRIDEVAGLVRRLDITQHRNDALVQKIDSLNLNGLVLSTCNLGDLQAALQLPLGDWTLFRLLIETLRAMGVAVPGTRMTAAERRKKSAILEVDEDVLDDEVGEDMMLLPAEEETAAQMRAREQRGGAAARRPYSSLSRSVSRTKDLARPRSHATIVLSDLNSDHKWLMESLSGMDLAETEGDLLEEAAGGRLVGGVTSPASQAASVRFDDDNASSADSTESRFGSRENLLDPVSIPPSSSSSRGELMGRIHNNSIHSDGSGKHSLLSDEDEHQLTVQRRDQTRSADDDPGRRLSDLFRSESRPDSQC